MKFIVLTKDGNEKNFVLYPLSEILRIDRYYHGDRDTIVITKDGEEWEPASTYGYKMFIEL